MFASTREFHCTLNLPYFDISFVVASTAFPTPVLHMARCRVAREAIYGGADPMRSDAKFRYELFR